MGWSSRILFYTGYAKKKSPSVSIPCVAGGFVRAESAALAVEKRYKERRSRERNKEEATY